MKTISIPQIVASACVGTAGAASQSVDIRDTWKDHPGQFAKAVEAGAGFSFHYGGRVAGPEFSSDWEQSFTIGTQPDVSKTTLTHKSGLVVTRELRAFPELGAIEYKLAFSNTGKEILPAISNMCALDLSFGESVINGNCVISSGGGLADGFLPPRSYAIRKNCFTSTESDGGVVILTTEGGRSSNKELPFFFVQNTAREEGLYIGFGWSGQWIAAVRRNPAARTLNVRGKIPDLEIALQPGEEIEGPTVLVGLYQGVVRDGSNQLRRLIRDVYTPRLSGNRVIPVATFDTWFNVAGDFDETLLRSLANAAAAIGQEYFLLDASWYAGAGRGWDFSSGLGNWYEVDKNKLPNGLLPIADYVRSKGLQFGLWFEPERVAPCSQLARQHPDWVLWGPAHQPETEFSDFNRGYGVLDYGRPEVQQWVRELLDHHIREYGVKYIRYDFNIDPLPHWNACDKAHRRGISQLRHIKGLYAIIDWIRVHHPDTVLEGCASGGRRIDLETARRFHTFWISDYTFDPSVVRFHLFGINYFLPGNYHYVQYALPLSNQKNCQPEDIGFQSMFGGAFGTGGRVDLWPEEMREMARRHIDIWKRLRRYLVEDYYPLSDQPSDLESWSGWQFQDPANQSGFIQTFRTRTHESTHRFIINNLNAQALYRFTDAYSGQAFDVIGSAAMNTGIEVTQETMSSRVYMYTRILE